MEPDPVNLFQLTLNEDFLFVTNHEGIRCTIPLQFLAKETHIGDQLASYQLLRLKHGGLFGVDELYTIADAIQRKFPCSLVNWEATFHIMFKEKNADLQKKLKAFHLM